MLQFGRSSESAFTGSELESDAYQVAEKAKKLAHEVTSLAGQLHNTRGAERRRPLMPLVRRLCFAACTARTGGTNGLHVPVDSVLPADAARL